MYVMGIDISTFNVDCAKVSLNDDPPQWHRFTLTGEDAFDRARSVRDAMPGRSTEFFDDLVGCGIEDPRGQSPGVIYRVQGAVLACLPPHLLVHPLVPSQWRRLVGLPGNATKERVMDWVLCHSFDNGWRTSEPELEQDACDAYCVALATRSLITQPKEGAPT